MLEEGLEPTLLSEPDPKSGASANFAIRAAWIYRFGRTGKLFSKSRCATFCATFVPRRTGNIPPKCMKGRFIAVLDSRKRKVRGLVSRNGRFYAQMRVPLPSGKSRAVRVVLKASRLAEAIAEAERARTEKRNKELHLPANRPRFSEVVKQYLESATFKTKKEGTRQNETQALKRWVEYLGSTRIDWIEEKSITAYRDRRKLKVISNRTINLDVTAFNNAMRYAVEMGWVKSPPRVKKLKEPKSPRRQLLTQGQIGLLLEKAKEVSKNADLLRLYIRFLVSSGCREQEALHIRKCDVDLNREVLQIGWDGDTKNNEGREVQFNSSLKKVVTEILDSLPSDTTWLFPSPQRGEKDIHAKSLRDSFYATRRAAGLNWVGFHDFRHYFTSQCVMAGIDYMTIAKWLGHQDGGILVGKVYGHLSDEHRKKMAERLDGRI